MKVSSYYIDPNLCPSASYRVPHWTLSLASQLRSHKLSVWLPRGTVLTGGMHDDVTTMWYCVDQWNSRWPGHIVVLCWLVECTMIWPPWLTGGMHDDLTTMWHSVDWWNAQWFVSDPSIQMNVICLIWLKLIVLVHNERAPCLCWRFNLFRINQPSAPLLYCDGWRGSKYQLTNQLHCNFWGKHGRHSLFFSRAILTVTFWLAEAARWFAVWNPL